MDKAKAKKAVKKSASRKKAANEQMAAAQIAAAMQTAHVPTVSPEVQKGTYADLQPADGLQNPYRPLGSVAPTMYTPGNLLPGYNAPHFTGA